MKLKRKLISCICMFAVALTSLVVGVWALKTVDFTVGGNLSYVAPGIEATISKGTLANGTFVNSADASTKMPQTQITKTDTASTLATKFSYWQNLSLAFNEAGDDTTITFSITNDMSSKYLVIDISTAYNSADNATISINTSSAVLEPSASQSFTITLAVTDKTADASLYGFSVVFNMTMSDSNPVVDLQYDSTNDYYYVEMGTYNSSAVRWKLVGVNGEHLGSADAPDAGKGTFILETYTGAYHAFGSVNDDYTIGNNDYSSSYIREYLTGNSSYALDYNGNVDNTAQGSFLTDFNIAEDDEVYSAITARKITDLYKDIGWAESNIGGGQQYAPPAGTTQNATYDITPKTSVGADKLWLMSAKEAYTLLGGGEIGEDKIIDGDWSINCNTDNLLWLGDTYEFYWLRSPFSDNSSNACFIDDSGFCSNDNIRVGLAVRPAFNVRFKYTAPVPAEEVSYLTFTYNDTTMEATLISCEDVDIIRISIPSAIICNEDVYVVKDLMGTYSNDGFDIVGIFFYCNSVKEVEIPSSVTSIGEKAFSGCTGLTSITIPDSVKAIGDYAFESCTGLTSITIPDSVTSIGEFAFSDCTGLTSATIGSGVTSIEGYTFWHCTSLTSITIPDSVTSIGGSAFYGCTGLTNVTIGSGVTSIGDYVFYMCTSLTSITIPDSVTSIGGSAFSGCTGLTSITIPDSVTSIGGSAFSGCTGLTNVTIGSGVTSIGSSAFSGCTNLAEVNVKATSVPTGGNYMFFNCSSSLVIYVPTGSESAYKAATYWSDYASKIQGKSF